MNCDFPLGLRTTWSAGRQTNSIWGWTKAGDNVTVQLGDETQTAKADSTGRWQVSFSPCPAGGPFILSANSGSTIKVSDVLIGDVWLISGQSNMQIPVKNRTGAEETIKTSQDDKLRLVHINDRPSYLPQETSRANGSSDA